MSNKWTKRFLSCFYFSS